MWKLKLWVLIVSTCFCRFTFGQGKVIVIPFQLTEYNNISVQAILNQEDSVNLMFHTAASFVTLTKEATQKLKSLKFDNTIDNIKSWGGDGNSARVSKNNSLQIGELTYDSVSISENINSGQQTDGKFGIDLFKNKVIELNFDKSLLIISDILPFKARDYEKLKLSFENDMLFLEVNCRIDNRDYKNKFLIHSGYSGAILLDDKFVSDNQIDKKLEIIGEKELKDSYGNSIKTKKAILPILKIGHRSLSDIPVGFFEGAIGRQKMSIIGGELLKRFNIIIDAKRGYIYLKPNNL